MSSLINNNKYKIVLFQGGLQDDGEGFKKTLELLEKSSSDCLKYKTKIDMSDFNTQLNCFFGKFGEYYSKSTQALIDFKILIADIVAFSKENKGKSILVSTFLNKAFKSEYNLDSIENQKIKLNFIIDELKRYDNVEISLVGHSQGGLVNLECAIERNLKINKVISISTPYAPVYLGEKLIFLDFFMKLGGASAYKIFCNDQEEMDRYKVCTETLCSRTYFDDLKAKWNNLEIRPKLFVITSAAGHLYKTITDASGNTTIFKYPFDGLVTFKEQSAIEHAEFIHLADKTLPCYQDKQYANDSCYVQTGFIITCKRACPLSSINFGNTVAKILLELIDRAIKHNEVDAFKEYKVVKAIESGIYEKSYTDDDCMEYYKIYSNSYNHSFVRKNTDLIAHLLALLI